MLFLLPFLTSPNSTEICEDFRMEIWFQCRTQFIFLPQYSWAFANSTRMNPDNRYTCEIDMLCCWICEVTFMWLWLCDCDWPLPIHLMVSLQMHSLLCGRKSWRRLVQIHGNIGGPDQSDPTHMSHWITPNDHRFLKCNSGQFFLHRNSFQVLNRWEVQEKIPDKTCLFCLESKEFLFHVQDSKRSSMWHIVKIPSISPSWLSRSLSVSSCNQMK